MPDPPPDERDKLSLGEWIWIIGAIAFLDFLLIVATVSGALHKVGR
jgi:hypothetical protein